MKLVVAHIPNNYIKSPEMSWSCYSLALLLGQTHSPIVTPSRIWAVHNICNLERINIIQWELFHSYLNSNDKVYSVYSTFCIISLIKCYKSDGGLTWLTQTTGAPYAWLRRWSVLEKARRWRDLCTASSAWNSLRNRAATESTTTSLTRPRFSSTGTRWDTHARRASCSHMYKHSYLSNGY